MSYNIPSFLTEEPLDFLAAPSQRNLFEIFSDSSDDDQSEKINTLVQKKIKPGSQEEKDGDIYPGLAEYHCEVLNEFSKETHVLFSADRLESNLTGGTCSAMSFKFADTYLKRRPSSAPEQIFEDIGDLYEQSSKIFRTRQAAFNTIHKDPAHPSTDFMRDKIDAMLRLYDRKITDASEPFSMKVLFLEGPSSKELQKTEGKITSFLNKYPEGVFVVRCILPEQNDKEEHCGHSTILIREGDKSYFYDPNEGISEIPSDPKALVDVLSPMMQRWGIPNGRIYKIQ